jgi:VCBS repeat-containing protein
VGDGVLGNDSLGGDGGTLEVSSSTPPSNGTLTINADGSFIYVPNPDFNGVDSFTYTITDTDGTTSTATVEITVNSVDDSPLAQDDPYSVDEDGTLTVVVGDGVLGNDNLGGDGGTLEVSSSTPPSNGTLTINADGSFTYVPNPDFNGVDSFT